MSERSIGDKADDKTEESVAAERGPLSVGEFLQGVRAQRRAVKIRPNLHLLSDMQRLVDEIESAPADQDVDDLIDRYEETKGQFLAVEWWTVEQRTHERRSHVRREAAKALDVELDEGDNVPSDDREVAAKLEAAVIADHIVEPEGVTAEQVMALYEASPGEYTKIEQAIVQTMRILDEDATKGVLRDFSLRRSEKTGRY